ncbi:MAG: glutathione synthase [Betaproteobacteria bacterium]|nr:glutathione synthase [Betaproteobacteria bacterium]
MKLAFLVDPLESLQPKKDSSIEMMRAAQRRGHSLHAIEPGDLRLAQGQVLARAIPLALTGTDLPWFSAAAPQILPLTHFDAVLMRKDPPVDSEYLYATYLLELAERSGARVFNRPRALRDFNEKLAAARFPDLCPPLLVSCREEALRDFVRNQGDVILKPLDSMGGNEIFRVSEQDPNFGVILETMTRRGQRTIMAQRYLPAIVEGDKRILVVDGEVMPYCLARIPATGETRGNLAAGGTGRAQPLSPRDRFIAEAVAPALKEAGLLLVGLDVIGDCLTEINVTSPTCMREIRDQTGLDAGQSVIEALERIVG